MLKVYNYTSKNAEVETLWTFEINLFYLYAHHAPIRGTWHCYCGHLNTVSSQNVQANAKCWLSYESHVRIAFRDSNLHNVKNCWNPGSWSADARMAGSAAIVHTTACRGMGKWLHTLPPHPALDEPEDFNSWRMPKFADSVCIIITVTSTMII